MQWIALRVKHEPRRNSRGPPARPSRRERSDTRADVCLDEGPDVTGSGVPCSSWDHTAAWLQTSFRIIEATLIVVSLVGSLSLVALSEEYVGRAGAASAAPAPERDVHMSGAST